MAGMARTAPYTGTSTAANPTTRRVGTGRASIAVPATPTVPKTSAVQAATNAIQNPPKNYVPQIEKQSTEWMADPAQIQAAAKSMMPMYQARLGGLQGSTMDAMRLNAQQDIQSQYGNALRAATQQAGTQGIRGPAAVAMQQDIRNQMGQAQAKYSRDLTVADWDAKRQALADYYGIYQQQAGTGIGTLSALQQLLIAQQAQQQQAGILRG